MKRVWVLLAALVLATMFLMRQPAMAPGGGVISAKPVTLGSSKFFLEVADEPSEREKGLAGRTTIDPRGGMLFVFGQPDRQCFWMKDTLIPLDMLWFDSSYKLVYIQEKVQPDSYPHTFCSDKDALYVVELAAGTVADKNLRLGDMLTL